MRVWQGIGGQPGRDREARHPRAALDEHSQGTLLVIE
jgi:hypothetical protein